jgi:hypothetical protein
VAAGKNGSGGFNLLNSSCLVLVAPMGSSANSKGRRRGLFNADLPLSFTP